MPRRQTIPVDEIRAPPVVDDQMSAEEVREKAGDLTNLSDLLNVIASQFRIVTGGAGWLDPTPPGTTTPFTGELVVAEQMLGARDGSNIVFKTQRGYVPGTLTLSYNGQQLTVGTSADYVSVDSAGTGLGNDTIKLTGMIAPRERDVLLATYVRVA